MPRVQIQRLTALFGLLIPTFITIGSSRIRKRVALYLGLQGRGIPWKFIAIVLALANLKNLPWAWHYRVLKGIIYQIWFQPTDLPPESLFKYMITKSHCPLWETDYNLHKNNSTYFSDADVARTHLVTALLRRGIRGVGKQPGDESTTWNLSTAVYRSDQSKFRSESKLKSKSQPILDSQSISKPLEKLVRSGRNMTEEEFIQAALKPGNLLIMLGGVACFFHREILPYRTYELWTRLLTWDRKWLYLVTYFVKPGTILPSEYDLQPWKNSKKSKGTSRDETIEQRKTRLQRCIHATSIATYVVKKGSLTIPPEIVLQRSSLLPPKPKDAPSLFYVPEVEPESESKSPSPITPINITDINGSVDSSLLESRQTITVPSIPDLLVESLVVENNEDWTWEYVEKERQRGLKYAAMFDGLTNLRDEFDGEKGGALGRFTDLLPGL